MSQTRVLPSPVMADYSTLQATTSKVNLLSRPPSRGSSPRLRSPRNNDGEDGIENLQVSLMSRSLTNPDLRQRMKSPRNGGDFNFSSDNRASVSAGGVVGNSFGMYIL